MNINRSNYEIWLIDLLDSNLNDTEVDAVMSFLDANPDLKDEFEGLSGVQISKPDQKFPFSDILKKSTSELTDSQFENLCVASLEKDMNQQQEEELNEILTTNPEREKQFRIFQKLVLLPPQYTYPDKRSLKKNSFVRPSVPLYISLLSAAAIIAFVIYSDLLFRRDRQENNIHLAQKVMIDSFEIKDAPAVKNNIAPDEADPGSLDARKTASRENSSSDLNKGPVLSREVIQKIELKSVLSLKSDFYRTPGNNLIAMNTSGIPQVPVKEKIRIRNFLAREYRDIVLKEKKPSDKPIDGFEIAEGGIIGLNKILGWEMALEKNSDENGNTKSIHFDSRILKINAPVKKAKPQL